MTKFKRNKLYIKSIETLFRYNSLIFILMSVFGFIVVGLN